MSIENSFFEIFSIVLVVLTIMGLYCMMVSRNLIRIVVGIEILMKAVTLLIAYVGYVTKRTTVTQSYLITMIVVEVIVLAVAMGIIIKASEKTGSLNIKELSKLRG